MLKWVKAMKLARVAVLGVALGAGLIAARMVTNLVNQPPQAVEVVRSEPTVSTEAVLVASKDIMLGARLQDGDLSWQGWPKGNINDGFITRSARPEALAELGGRIARAPMFSGEPVREQRLIQTDRGFMAAILPKGKRAVAVSVEALTTAGGFILPDDRVDVILTRSARRGGNVPSETILENVRVLAIDTTTVGEQDKKSLPPSRTATVELSPPQAEIIMQAQQAGTLSLALRSAEDSLPGDDESTTSQGGLRFVKFGVVSQTTTRR